MYERGYREITNVTTRQEVYDAIASLDIGFVKDENDGKVYWKNSGVYLVDGTSNTQIALKNDNYSNTLCVAGDVPNPISASWVGVIDYIKFNDSIVMYIHTNTTQPNFMCAIIAPKTQDDKWVVIGRSAGTNNYTTPLYEIAPTEATNYTSFTSQALNYAFASYPTDSFILTKFWNGRRWLDNIEIAIISPRLASYSANKYTAGNKTWLICHFTNIETLYSVAFDITDDLET